MANLSYLHKLKKTPLHIAIGNKNHKIVKELLDNHSNIRAFDVKEYRYYHFDRKKQIKTPLFLAIENNDIEMVELLLSYDDIETKYGLFNLNGCEYPIRSGQYHPRIRNDIQKITDEKKVSYFLRKKGNYDTNGYFSESEKRLNDEKYINMVEEEDFDDDYSFIYEIYDNISPIKAAETIKNDKIKEMVQYMFDKQHYNDEEESDDKEDTDVKFFFCKDYFY